MENNTTPKITKRCTKCDTEKEISPNCEFPVKKGNQLSSWCKLCHKEYSKKHYRQHADYKIERAKEWQKNNKEKVRTYVNKYKATINSQTPPT